MAQEPTLPPARPGTSTTAGYRRSGCIVPSTAVAAASMEQLQ